MRFSKTLVIALFVTRSAAAATMEIDRAATAIAGREASFTQRFTPKGFKTAQVENGSVVFGTLPMMRWSYVSPEQKLFVFDGRQSWFYVPADHQVTVGQIDDAHKRELPFLMVGDPAARDRFYIVHEQARRGSVMTTLRPRDPGATIRDVNITSNPVDHLISRIEYSDRAGNSTIFELTGYHSHPAVADTFHFTPPAGTQVVNAH